MLVDDSAVFTMYDGIIAIAAAYRAVPFVWAAVQRLAAGRGSGSEFIMHGGTIKNCTDNYLGGGAVCIRRIK